MGATTKTNDYLLITLIFEMFFFLLQIQNNVLFLINKMKTIISLFLILILSEACLTTVEQLQQFRLQCKRQKKALEQQWERTRCEIQKRQTNIQNQYDTQCKSIQYQQKQQKLHIQQQLDQAKLLVAQHRERRQIQIRFQWKQILINFRQQRRNIRTQYHQQLNQLQNHQENQCLHRQRQQSQLRLKFKQQGVNYQNCS